jgi:triacylglycerol lipase
MKTLSILGLLVINFSSAVRGIEYKRGLTDHFIGWLNDTGGYEPYNFNRTDYFGGSFGGKENDSSIIKNRPVIFIHGNQDMLIGDSPENNGFRLTIEYFLSQGYSKSELYGSMWGYPDVPHRHYF